MVLFPGGFAQSELMSGHLINFFVPFLPLEYRHVRLCAQDAYIAQGLEPDKATLAEVAKAMLYARRGEAVLSPGMQIYTKMDQLLSPLDRELDKERPEGVGSLSQPICIQSHREDVSSLCCHTCSHPKGTTPVCPAV
ncbi:hypothetical protein LDENG_00044210 [Lucifuga dentata]|nr:hypothetical protein LDENG_00044210 [Lucifuga dentata]